MGHRTPIATITTQDFLADPHAAKYRDVVTGHPEAFARVVAILNDPYQQEQLVAAERFGHPALSGVVGRVEGDEIVAESLASPASQRFRQAVGVAVRLTMQSLGWVTTGSKGPVRGATHFKTSERYAIAPTSPGQLPNLRARAVLDEIESIGEETEREQTAKELVAALAESRRAENRPF